MIRDSHIRRAFSLVMLPALLSLLVVNTACAQYKQDPDQYYKSPHTVHGKTVIIPRGTHLEGNIDATIGSSISKAGQRFNIIISNPILANGVDVIIPSGSHIICEVVEAISSSHLPKEKNQPKPTGKLRIRIASLKTPDGVTYPLVASIAGETLDKGYGREEENEELGGGMAYVGSSASFEAVAPGKSGRHYRGQGPKVVTKDELMRDPIYGKSNSQRNARGKAHIRSLVKRGHELYIDNGSPLSIRLDAPFKIGFNPAGMGAQIESDTDEGNYNSAPGAKRFQSDDQIKSFKPDDNSVPTKGNMSKPADDEDGF